MLRTKQLEKKLKDLPTTPGVYFYRDAAGEVIYIGKAANLRHRVRQYFQNSRLREPKTDALIAEIAGVAWTEVASEADALFLEAELVRRYLPRFNILLRDDKSQLYVRIDYKNDYPTLNFVRRPLDDGARYFGPYLNSFAVKKALRYLRRAFPYAISRQAGQKRASLHYHLGLDPGLEDSRTSLPAYRANLRKLMQYLKGERVALMRTMERDMKAATGAHDFEKAARIRNQLQALQQLARQSLFGNQERLDASRDQALTELSGLLGLAKPPKRLEAFDVSHIQGTDTVASLAVFINGVPDKTAYRKFKMRKLGNDDTGHIYEAISRRFSQDNQKAWGLPDLILIDGGKGQLQAGLKARDQAGLSRIPMIGLAKREESIIVKKPTTPQLSHLQGGTLQSSRQTGGWVKEEGEFWVVRLPQTSHVVELLQRMRDESHRFAQSYHFSLRRTRQTKSLLDEIPGIGPATRKRLMKAFGSTRTVVAASEKELQAVLGPKKGRDLAKYLSSLKS